MFQAVAYYLNNKVYASRQKQDEDETISLADCCKRCPRQFFCSKQILWVLVPISFVIAYWQIQMLVSDFFDEPHYVSKSFFVSETYPTFPNVSVCNFNRVNKTKARELGLSDAALEHLFLAQVATYQLWSPDYPEILDRGRTAWAAYQNRTDISTKLKDAGHLLRYLAHSCEQTFIACIFGGEKFNCCTSAVQILNAEYGACWIINAPVFTEGEKWPKQPWTGVSGGLKLFILPALEEYVSSITVNNYLEDGILAAPTFDPYNAFYARIVAISPGSHAQLAMDKRVRASKKPQMEVFTQNCTSDRKLVYIKGIYDHSSCEDDCNQREVINACGCTQMQEVTEVAWGYRTCDGNDVADCVEGAVSKSWIDTALMTPFRLCMNGCQKTCNRIEDVSTIVSMNAYPGRHFKSALRPWLQRTLKTDISHKNQRALDDLILLDVFFPGNYYVMIEETEKVSVFQLVGSIGGQLGLWLGVSVITSFEAIANIFRRMRRSLTCKKQPKRDKAKDVLRKHSAVQTVETNTTRNGWSLYGNPYKLNPIFDEYWYV